MGQYPGIGRSHAEAACQDLRGETKFFRGKDGFIGVVDNVEGAEVPVVVGLDAKVAVFKSLGKKSWMAR